MGTLVRIDQGVAFKPAGALADEIRDQSFRSGKEVAKVFGSEFEPPQSHSGTELLEAVASRLLEKDCGLERLQAEGGQDTMEAVWRTFGAAIHD